MATEYTDEQYAEMEAALAERDARHAAAAAALEAARIAQENIDLAPLRAWLASAPVQQVMNELETQLESIREIPRVSPYAFNFLATLANAAGPAPQVEEGNTDGE